MFSVSFFFLCCTFGYSQMTTAFEAKLQAAKLEFLQPLDAGYKELKSRRNDFQNYDHAIYSRKEKLEIRYLIVPYDSLMPTADLPHLVASQMMINLSNNTEAFTGSAFSYTEEAARSDFNADWACEFLFKPKPEFSSKSTCRMLSIHKDEVGTAYVFLLFDKIPELLDARTISLRFLSDLGEPEK